jgi:branched-chain amino acid transport system substrate-binding protein
MERLTFRRIVICLGMVTLVLSVLSGTGYAAKEIKVGIGVGLTGPTAPWGKPAWNGYQLAFDEINAGGGIRSMGGAKIKYMLMDHQSKPEVAGANAEMLIRDKVCAILGSSYSDAGMVASQVCQRAKISYISASDADPMMTERGFNYVFRVCPSGIDLSKGAIEFTKWVSGKSGKSPKNVALLSAQTAGLYPSYKFYEKNVPAVYNVVFKETYPLGQQDFTGIVSKIKELKVDYMFMTSGPGDAVMLTRAFKEMNFCPTILGNVGGHLAPDYIGILGKDADYTFCSTWFASDLKVPRLKELIAKYRARFGIELDVQAALAATATSVLVDSLERAGTDDPAKLREAIKATNMEVGKYWYVIPEGCKFDEKNHNIKQTSVVFQIRDGKWKCVYPEQYASTEPVYPVPPWEKR